MIDWWGLFHNSLWIVGLAVNLAALSMASYEAHSEEATLRRKLREPGFQVTFSAGTTLFCLGLALSSHSWWEKAVWAVLAAIFAAQLMWIWRGKAGRAEHQNSKRESQPTGQGPRIGDPRIDPGDEASPGVRGSDQESEPAGHSSERELGRTENAGSRDKGGKWLGWGLVLAGLLVIGGWTAVTVLQLVDNARSVQSHLQQLEQLTAGEAGGLGAADLASAGEHVTGLRQDIEAIQSQAGSLAPVGQYLGWVPEHGGDLVAASDLLEMATRVASAGDRTFRALSPALDLLTSSAGNPDPALTIGERVLPLLVAAQPELQAAQQELVAVKEARKQIDTSSLSPRAAGLLERLDRYLPWFEMAVDGAILAPGLLGVNSPRTYLLLAQNNYELRAGGGFISGVGELTVEDGRVVSVRFSDSYAVDNLKVPHDLTPPNFQTTLFGQLWFFRDTNWDADFPTSARRALSVYARDRGVQADGVIALDLPALQLLVDAIGPIEVEGIDEPVTGENVLGVVEDQWSQPFGGEGREWWLHRKDFMGEIARAAMDQLMTGQNIEPARLAQRLKQALDEKHLLIYLADPQAGDLLRKQNWDGAVPLSPPPSDMLMVVDSNVGMDKMDANVARAIRYKVDLGAEEGPRGRLNLSYRNLSSKPTEACIQESRYGDSYADMMERCYWDYVRVYVPPGSQLLEGPVSSLPPGSLLARYSDSPPQVPISATLTEGDWTVWAAFFDLAPGGELALTFDYQLPSWVLERDAQGLIHYRLRVQKQPGTEAVPLQVEMILPPDIELVEAMPAGAPAVTTDLRMDREFEIVYREGEGPP